LIQHVKTEKGFSIISLVYLYNFATRFLDCFLFYQKERKRRPHYTYASSNYWRKSSRNTRYYPVFFGCRRVSLINTLTYGMANGNSWHASRHP